MTTPESLITLAAIDPIGIGIGIGVGAVLGAIAAWLFIAATTSWASPSRGTSCLQEFPSSAWCVDVFTRGYW